MLTPRSSMKPGSEDLTICVAVASVSAFIALVAIILVLVWLWRRRFSRQQREEFESEVADLQDRLRNVQDEDERRSSSPSHLSERLPRSRRPEGEDLRRAKAEVEYLHGELSKAWESNTNLKQQVENLGRDLDAERRRGQVWSNELQQMHRQMEELRTQNAHLKAQALRASEMKQTEPTTQAPLQKASEEPRKAASRMAEAPSTHIPSTGREWEIKLDDERKRSQDLFTRNQYLQDELKSARKYGSMEDQYSGAEVVNKVEKLNSDILQVSATMAEGLEVDEWVNDRGVVVDNANESNGNLVAIIGRELVNLLKASASQDLNIVLQTAFQASMAYHIRCVILSWCYKYPQEERLFEECYRSMQRHELQAVYGRWRQLTTTHLKGSRSAYEQYLLPTFVNALSEIVIAAGYKESSTIVYKQIMDRFASRLEEVIKTALDLHRVIGEGITSCDLSVVWHKPGTLYDPGVMEETFGRTTGNDKEAVSCVTDVGLRSTEKVSGSTKVKHLVLLRAKVLLPSRLSGIRVRDA